MATTKKKTKKSKSSGPKQDETKLETTVTKSPTKKKKKKKPVEASATKKNKAVANKNKDPGSREIVTASPENNEPTAKKKTTVTKKKKTPIKAPPTKPPEKAKSPATVAKKERSTAKTDAKSDQDERRRRNKYLIGGIICCLLLALILALSLGLALRDKGDDDTSPNGSNNVNTPSAGPPSSTSGGPNGPLPTASPVIIPTQAPVPLSPSVVLPLPTFAPIPTMAPVPTPTNPPDPTPAPVLPPTSLLAPTPTQYILVPFADTVVYRDGFLMFEAFGDEDTWLVQNGPAAKNEIPDAVGLLAFDWADLPSNIRNANIQSVTLQVFHQPRNRDRGAATYRLRRLPWQGLFVESLTAQIFNPDDDAGVIGPNLSVSPNDTIRTVDVTDLVLNANVNDGGASEILLMMENVGPEQGEGAEGDRFFSRETFDPPQLIIQYN